jgi:hypothetical protein
MGSGSRSLPPNVLRASCVRVCQFLVTVSKSAFVRECHARNDTRFLANPEIKKNRGKTEKQAGI